MAKETVLYPDVAVYDIPNNLKPKIKVLHDKGWTSSKIQKRYRKFTKRQIGALRGWMRRGQ